MSEVKWTNEQQDAIYEKGKNILVAAAAGSGKTAVLVERIINKIINENIDIDKLLVVTFTNAAASEMRERVLNAIYKKLEIEPENEKLQKQITLLNKANICTIDSFCLEVVRNNFYELENIAPNFRIADTTQIELLKQEVIENIFDKKYEEENEDFYQLINTYTSYRDDTPLKELILKIYDYIQSEPFPEKWLKEKIEMFNIKEELSKDFSSTLWGKVLLEEIEEELIDSINSLENVQKDLSLEPELEKFEQTIRNDIDMLVGLKNNLDSWDKAYSINQALKFVTWPRQKVDSILKDEAKQIRDGVKKKLEKVLNKIIICDSKQANQDIYDMHKILVKLQDIIIEFGDEFTKQKRLQNIVDFSDVEHLALQILVKEDEGEVVPTDVARKYQEKFIEIAIDEYQDSNLVQEYILTSVSKGNNIFMVGDVKQSIYKFRQAMPELFLSKYKEYLNKKQINAEETNYADYKTSVEADHENDMNDEKNTYKELKSNELNINSQENIGLKIQLFKNFRSRENVLDFTNLIFQDIMSNLLGDIEYNEEEYLNLGAGYSHINQDLNTEINIIDLAEDEENKEDDLDSKIKSKGSFEEKEITDFAEIDSEEDEAEERIENIELEARFVANKVKKLVEEKFQIWDRKKEEYRDIEYRDIVILLRSTANSAPIYEQELLKLEIPVFSDSSQEYLDSIEIQTMMSLLKIIDNPIQDIPLVTVLRSQIGGFTDDELVKIRLSDKYDNFYTCMQKSLIDVNKELKEKIERFLNNLSKWRKEQEYLALDELIWKIYGDTGFYNYVGLMPNGELRQANLKMLFQKAKQYESTNFKGLYNFINFVDKLRLSSGDMGAAKLIGENDNVVRIMSIHKSKGLEFPVVFLSNTAKQFNLMDLNQNVLLHQDLGIGVKYIDYDMQIQYDTLTKTAIRNKILTETISEEMRILYVALTRAKEKLIITGISKNYAEEQQKMLSHVEQYEKKHNKINPILVKKYKKYLDWIMLVYQYEKNKIDTINLNVIKKKKVLDENDEKQKETVDLVKLLEEKTVNKDCINDIETILNYKYPNILATKIPTKTSVTSLKDQTLNNEIIEIMDDIITENNKEFKKIEFENDIINRDNEKIKNIEFTNDIMIEDNKELKNIEFPKPEFLREEKEEKLTGAQKGTLVHMCMQRLDEKEDYDINKIRNLITGLLEKQIITQKEAESINLYKILEFTKSNIWEELKNAKEVYKEKPFYINIPAKDIYIKLYKNENSKEILNEEILVQGIIDLYYINQNDELVLVDYKTDYVEERK